MQKKIDLLRLVTGGVGVLFAGLMLGACSTSTDSTTASDDGVSGIAFVKRSVSSVGDPLEPVGFTAGGDLMTLVPGTPSGKLQNLTGDMTNGEGDVSDPEIFPQSIEGAQRLVFSMRKNSADKWHLYEVVVNPDGSRKAIPTQLTCGDDNDIDPAFLPDGRIVFSSDRPGHLDEYERRKSSVLHILDPSKASLLPAKTECIEGEVVQISFNQSHDRNPTVLKDGTIMFSRWEHLAGVNKFTVFRIEPDGTDLFVKFGSHSGVNSFLDVRERSDGKLTAMMMPLSGTFEGGAIGVLDAAVEADNGKTSSLQLTTQAIPAGGAVSENGRYHSAYQVPDGSNRYLTAYSKGAVVSRMEEAVEGEEEEEIVAPSYGIWMFNADGTLKPIKIPAAGSDDVYLEPIPLMAVPQDQIPTKKSSKVANRIGMGETGGTRETGVLAAASVYDSEANRALSPTVLGVDIRDASGNINFEVLIADETKQVVKFVRVIEAVPSMPGVGREDIGSTRFERQKVLGYAPVEKDGSFRVTVPADTSLTLNVVDSEKRSFKVKENWLQVRPGENKTCNGCHSPRIGNPQRLATDSIALNRIPSALVPPSVEVIDYMDHIQTIFDAEAVGKTACSVCHSVLNPAAVGPAGDLDLSKEFSGSGFPFSYENLVGDMDSSNLVTLGESRQSALVEFFFGEKIRSGKDDPAFYNDANHTDSVPLSVDNRMTLVEWIDLGAQFTNKLIISNPGRLNLDQGVFTETIHPILMTRCASCHVAGGDSDFVLTGDAEGDFGAAISRSNVTTPANSLLLLKAIGLVEGGLDMFQQDGAVVTPSPLSTLEADYDTILAWITAAN